jgi:LPS export ABC transporter protein LptC
MISFRAKLSDPSRRYEHIDLPIVKVVMKYLVIIATLLLVGLVSWGCGDSSEPEESSQPTELQVPDQILTNSEIYLTNNGRRTGIIKSDTLKVYQAKDTTLLYGLQVDFFDTTGAHILTLTSDSGLVTKHQTALEAIGNVVAWSDNGKRLETDSLRWDASTGKVTTEGYVEANRGEDKISGWGLETDQNLENIIIKRDARGSFVQPKFEGD